MRRAGLVEMEVAPNCSLSRGGQLFKAGAMFVCDAKEARQLIQAGKAVYLRPHRQPVKPRRRVSGRDLLQGGFDRAILGKEHGQTR